MPRLHSCGASRNFRRNRHLHRTPPPTRTADCHRNHQVRKPDTDIFDRNLHPPRCRCPPEAQPSTNRAAEGPCPLRPHTFVATRFNLDRHRTVRSRTNPSGACLRTSVDPLDRPQLDRSPTWGRARPSDERRPANCDPGSKRKPRRSPPAPEPTRRPIWLDRPVSTRSRRWTSGCPVVQDEAMWPRSTHLIPPGRVPCIR